MPEFDELTSYCGLYCPGCGIHQGKVTERVQGLQRILTSYKIGERKEALSQEEPAFKHYDEFEQVLDGIKEVFGSCAGCRKGGGIPDCKVRSCAEDRGYQTCLECVRMEACSELKSRSWALPALRKIRDEGYESWLKTKREMVEAGWSYVADSDV
ncbi:MAG: DUF3795 domain-containing protein [Candidatus Thorarchaeota archaeon]|jgi:hypothetical protein